jgi:hypothetical protein
LAVILSKKANSLTKSDLQIVAAFALEKLDYNRAMLVAKRHGLLKDSKSTDAFQEARTALVKRVNEADETALARLVIECALLDSAYHEPPSGDDRLLAAARKHRIDVDALARAVREEFAAKQRKLSRRQRSRLNVRPRLRLPYSSRKKIENALGAKPSAFSCRADIGWNKSRKLTRQRSLFTLLRGNFHDLRGFPCSSTA